MRDSKVFLSKKTSELGPRMNLCCGRCRCRRRDRFLSSMWPLQRNGDHLLPKLISYQETTSFPGPFNWPRERSWERGWSRGWLVNNASIVINSLDHSIFLRNLWLRQYTKIDWRPLTTEVRLELYVFTEGTIGRKGQSGCERWEDRLVRLLQWPHHGVSTFHETYCLLKLILSLHLLRFPLKLPQT